MRHDTRVGSGHHPAAAMKPTTAPESAPLLIDTFRMSSGAEGRLGIAIMAGTPKPERAPASIVATVWADLKSPPPIPRA